MALRRQLPSRLTGAPPAEASHAQSAPTSTPAIPETTPLASPAEVIAETNSDVVVAANSAFSTLSSPPPRILEESFTVPATPAASSPVIEPIVVAPAPTPAAPIVAAETTDFSSPASQASRPDENPLKRRVDRSARREAVRRPNIEQSAPSSAPAQTVAPSTPAPAMVQSADDNRPAKSRNKRPRDFSGAQVTTEAEQANAPRPMTSALAPDVPVDSRPIDRVDEELIASGITDGPPSDSLVSNLPAASAVNEIQDSFAPYMPQASFGAVESKPSTETSDLPWATPSSNAEWEVPALPATPAKAQPPVDIFKSVANTSSVPAGSAPWSAARTDNLPPPTLPGARSLRGAMPARHGAPLWTVGLGFGAVILVGVIIWKNISSQSEPQEMIARWTGSLREHTEKLPVEMGGVAPVQNPNLVQPESTFSMADINHGVMPPVATPGENALLPAPQLAQNDSTQIDFTDVPKDQANGPIVADGTEPMPDDVSLFAKFQKAVDQARAQKEGSTGAAAPTEAKAEDSAPLTPEGLKAELDAYRKSLASGTNADQIKANTPAKFEKDPDGYMDGKTLAANSNVLVPPAATAAENAQGSALLPPPQLYANNPANLPIVGEPTSSQAKIRTLADFEVQPFEPERERIRVPRNLRPKMATSDFPMLEVLSFVPSRGIIAFANGREGVLLLGETLEGWQLTNVTNEMAEFKSGQKSHYITTQN